MSTLKPLTTSDEDEHDSEHDSERDGATRSNDEPATADPESAPGRPHGKDEVIAAVVAAAGQLFARRGPDAVSLREIAAAANVNLGLIHRHIGSKHDLLAAVLAARPGVEHIDASRYERSGQIVMEMLGLATERPLFPLVTMRALMDGYDPAGLQESFPLLERAAELMSSTDLSADEVGLRVALGAAMVLGWHAIGAQYVRLLTHLELTDAEVLQALEPVVMAMFDAPGRRG